MKPTEYRLCEVPHGEKGEKEVGAFSGRGSAQKAKAAFHRAAALVGVTCDAIRLYRGRVTPGSWTFSAESEIASAEVD